MIPHAVVNKQIQIHVVELQHVRGSETGARKPSDDDGKYGLMREDISILSWGAADKRKRSRLSE